MAAEKTMLMLGGNIGNTKSIFAGAIGMIGKKAGAVLAVSGLYRSEPWGNKDQPLFYNQAVLIATFLAPSDLMVLLHEIESAAGRLRTGQNQSRTLDIDILYYGDKVINEPGLTIPHPRMHLRNFNMIPLQELEPEWVHPVSGKTISDLVTESPDTLKVYPSDDRNQERLYRS